jgi:DNA phosphorothioation-dependent restriction protein DptG
MKINVQIKSLSTFLYIHFHSLSSFSRCQFLSCTIEKGNKKKNRKNRLRSFPTQWNELTKEQREEIHRSLRKYILFSLNKIDIWFSSSEIPQEVQRCCTRCYDKLIIEIQQRSTSQTVEEEDDESTITTNQKLKHDDSKISLLYFLIVHFFI